MEKDPDFPSSKTGDRPPVKAESNSERTAPNCRKRSVLPRRSLSFIGAKTLDPVQARYSRTVVDSPATHRLKAPFRQCLKGTRSALTTLPMNSPLSVCRKTRPLSRLLSS